MPSSTPKDTPITVLGSGVLGLSIALNLHREGYTNLKIVARDLPEDDKSTGFASPWAGANWCSFEPEGGKGIQWDKDTFAMWTELTKTRPDIVQMIPFRDVWDSKHDPIPWFKNFVPEFRILKSNEAKAFNCKEGIAYKSFTVWAANYIKYLSGQLFAAGVLMEKREVKHIDDLFIGRGGVVVNATGLGARWLGGVRDETVFPIAGQTLVVRAKGVNTCYMKVEAHPGDETESVPNYIIPRPSPTGSTSTNDYRHIVLGGTFTINSYDTKPDAAVTTRILQKCYELCPALSSHPERGWEGIEVVSAQVGLRPAREDGCRVETEKRAKGSVVHAYGIGPAGFQASWGIAKHVQRLVEAIPAERASKL